MSYDCWIEHRHDHTSVGDPLVLTHSVNYTSNVAAMWCMALGGDWLSDLDGVTCDDAYDPLSVAVGRMEACPDAYREMNPENGWGNYAGALAYLEQLAQWCQDYSSCGRLRVCS